MAAKVMAIRRNRIMAIKLCPECSNTHHEGYFKGGVCIDCYQPDNDPEIVNLLAAANRSPANNFSTRDDMWMLQQYRVWGLLP